MKRFSLFPLLAGLVSGALCPSLHAQETNLPTAGEVRSLPALVAETLEKNPELRFYEAELTAARAGRKTAGQWANPELSSTVGQKRVRSGGLSDEGTAWSVSVLQPLEWPGRLGLRKAIANQDVALAELGLARFKAALAARVRLLGYQVFAAQEKAAASREVAGRFSELRETLVQRDPAGLTPLLETRVIEATELIAQRAASEAALTAQTALMELNQLRGVPTAAPLVIAPVQLTFGPAPDSQTLLAAAHTNNFELRQRAAELAQQGFRVALARNERYPALAVGPTYSEEKVGGDREQIIGVAISVPLPLWQRNRPQADVARARETQAEVSFTLAQRDIERQVLTAAQISATKRREMERWRPDAIQHFKEAAEVADRHYRLGAVPVSTYVDLQEKYLEAVHALLDTKREALEAAQTLELLTGIPQPVTVEAKP